MPKNDIRIDPSKLHPLLRFYMERTIEECNKQGIYLIITEGFRTKKRQDELYAQGRTTKGIIVTNAKGSDYNSQHQWGVAFDFAIANAGLTWDRQTMTKVASIAKKKCKHLKWGGDWTDFVDMPHLYLDFYGSTTAQLKKEFGNPTNYIKTFKATVSGTKKGLSIFNKARTKRLVKKQPNGTVFYILSRGKRWSRVYYNGVRGYALTKYLK